MSLEITKLIQDIAPYFKYENEPNATTQDQFQAFLKNLHAVVNCLARFLWQPETSYEVGHKIQSPNLPDGCIAIAISGGISSTTEPSWKIGEVADGTVRWNVAKSDVTVNGNAVDGDGNISIVTVENSNNATNANVASKLGTSNLGGASQPIYLKEGVATALSNTVGGTTQPIYMNGGVLTALTSTIGSSSTPLYLNGGKLTACSSALGAASNGGIIAQSLGTNGYVKFANGLILQWGFKNDSSASGTSNQTASLNIAFSNTDYALLKDIRCTNTGSGGMYFNAWGSISRTTTSFTYRYPNTTTGWSTFWVALGR